ncbi:zinc finger and SCAN domain-containing protein 10-like [Phymastichus coffea]|uniref:zinc finger and SCAN domain-containing protein 10-like n=1 Tax=Phymastichus coffea TaxID=108790 RepID=UPI00273CB444|nr:zinc finger and SCAN domain-containing protein 10-like [Phymastichus coffea]
MSSSPLLINESKAKERCQQPASKALQPYVRLSPLPSASRRVIGHKCSKCSQTFKWKESLYRHLEEECSGRPSLARDSDKARAPPSASSKGRHQCPTCGKTYKSRGFFDAHVRKVCGPANEASRAIQGSAWNFKSDHKCATCSRIFTSKRYLHQHIYRVHETHGYFCEHCGHAAKAKSRLARHIEAKHGAREPPRAACRRGRRSPAESAALRCEHCARRYGSKARLARHIQAEHEVVCREGPASANSLRARADLPGFVCDHCGLASQDKPTLALHIAREHADARTNVWCSRERLLLCHHCGYACELKDHLVAHIRAGHSVPK